MSITYGFLVPSGLEYSKEFSEAIHALFGDGVTKYGWKYSLTLGGSMKVNLSTGYAVANGRYIKHDEPFSLAFPASSNTGDRYDAVAAHVDYQKRKGEIAVLVDIDPDSPPRDGAQYNVVLYVVRIRRGASLLQPSDIRDVRSEPEQCGYIVPLSEISGDVEYIYNFLASGIDEVVSKLLDKIREIVEKADRDIAALESRIEAAGGTSVGDMEFFRRTPSPPNEWLLCDGAAVPSHYRALSEMLGGKLPNISKMGDRYRAYIYGGVPG